MRPFSVAIVCLCVSPMGAPLVAAVSRNYDFDGTISREVLENYLSRSLQFLGLSSEGSSGPAPFFEDNLRLIRSTGAKFIGRAAYAWDAPADDEAHFRWAREGAERVHALDSRIILQACVFETAYSSHAPEARERAREGRSPSGVEDIPIPGWVFEEFGLKREARGFDYEAMLYRDGRLRNHWLAGASVPDISRLETRLWFFYRAARYIDSGYEAIHFGQAQLVGQNDPDFRHWRELLDRVRRHATKSARRHYVLCDVALNVMLREPGVQFDGRLLWDFLSFPLRPAEAEQPLRAVLRIGHGDSLYARAPGGLHPGGWRCDPIPQLYEVDNFQRGLSMSSGVTVWGADEATWFANQSEAYRNEFLKYAWDWIWQHAAAGYLQMPGRRPALVPVIRPRLQMYLANTRSPACPEGFNQEETIRTIWNDPLYADNRARYMAPTFGGEKSSERTGFWPAKRAGADDLAGWWRCDAIVNEKGKPILRDSSPSGIDGRIEHLRSLEELQALYLVHGDFNEPDDRRRGEQFLGRMAADPGVSLVEERPRKSLGFHGNAHLNLGSDPLLAAPVFTLTLWLRVERLDRDIVPVEKFEWQRSGYYLKYHQSEKSLYGEIFDGGNTRRIVRFRGAEAGRWMQLALRADGQRLSAFLDGKLVDSVPAGQAVPNDLPLLVGRGTMDVCLADLRFYRRALGAAEISALIR